MGRIAKALRRLNNDLGFNQLGAYLESARKKKEQEELYANMINAFNNSQNNLSTIDNSTIANKENASNPFYKDGGYENYPSNPSMKRENVLSLSNMEGSSKPVGLAGLTSQGNAKQYTEPKSYERTVQLPLDKTEKYNRSQEEINNFQKSIIPMLLNPNSDPNNYNKANVLTSLLSKAGDKYKPDSYDYTDEDPTKRTVRINKRTGEREVLEEGSQKSNVKVLDERLDENGHKIVEYMDENGKRFTEDKGLDYKFILDQKRQENSDKRLANVLSKSSGNSNADFKEKKLTPSTAGLIAEIQNPQNFITDNYGEVIKFKTDKNGTFLKKKNDKGEYDFIEDENGQPMPIPESDKKYKQTNALKNIMIQKLNGRAYEFVTNMEDMWGRRLSPKELKDEAIKHAKGGELTDQAAGELADFLIYYKDIYPGLK